LDESQIARIVQDVYGKLQDPRRSDSTGQLAQPPRGEAVGQTSDILALIPLLRQRAWMPKAVEKR
jgi:hypothetical protein